LAVGAQPAPGPHQQATSEQCGLPGQQIEPAPVLRRCAALEAGVLLEAHDGRQLAGGAPQQGATACRDGFLVVFGLIQPAPAPVGQIRYGYVFTVRRTDPAGALRITDTAAGFVPAVVPAAAMLGGTPQDGVYFPGGSFYPWTPVSQMPATGTGPAASPPTGCRSCSRWLDWR
jgi:hypothetical protein